MHEQSEKTGLPISAIRKLEVAKEFQRNVGKKALILLSPFPFLVIGIIDNVMGDYVFILVETTSISELTGKLLRIHIDDIEVFFIEDGIHPIPVINLSNTGV